MSDLSKTKSTKEQLVLTTETDFNEQVEQEQADTKTKGDFLTVSEIFGPTFQGEGPTIGKPCFFLRLGACNLTCGANGGWQCDSLVEGTLVRLADGGWKPIEQISLGEYILGVEWSKSEGQVASVPKYVKAQSTLLNSHQDTECYELEFSDGTIIRCTGNHKFLVGKNKIHGKGWEYVETQNLTGREAFWSIGYKPIDLPITESIEFIQGWLSGYTAGDGCLQQRKQWYSGKPMKGYWRWETVDREIADRLRCYLEVIGEPYSTFQRQYTKPTVGTRQVYQTNAQATFSPIQLESSEFGRGFVSGLFDAEGSNNGVLPCINNKNRELLSTASTIIRQHGFEVKEDRYIDSSGCTSIQVLGGLTERFRFDDVFCPSPIKSAKALWDEPGKRGKTGKFKSRIGRRSILTLVKKEKVLGNFQFYDIGSSSGNFFANGVLLKNTSFTWDWTGINGIKYDPKVELRRMPVLDVVTKLEEMSLLTQQPHPYNTYASTQPQIRHLVISGGEPLLQQKSLIVLARILVKQHQWTLEIETNGTKAPSPILASYVSQFNVSPKLSNSGNSVIKRVHYSVLTKFVGLYNAVFKFVVSDLKDLDEIEDYVVKSGIPAARVYVMAEGISAENVEKHTQRVALETINRHWNLTTRLQVLTWGAKRGV